MPNVTGLHLGRGSARRCFLAFSVFVALCQPSLARADQVLVYQSQNNDPFNGDTAGPSAVALLRGLGHTVTSAVSLSAVLPADLSGFDSIWVISLVPLTGVQQTSLVDFVRRGGGLYLTGERPCCESVNGSNQAILNRLTRDITQLGRQGEGGDLFTAVSGDTWSITTTPNAVPTWLTGEAGLAAMIPARHQVYNHPNGKTGAAAWAGEDLVKAAGCVYLAMDLSWWFPSVQPTQNKALLTQNIQTFLGRCADSDNDGATDVGEAAAGTNPADPDSDDDGLCDGYGAVDGGCVPGESLYADTDMDGTVDPRDDDDDNDGLPTRYEVAAEAAAPNFDDDSIPAWLDLDSDNNNIPDRYEGQHDYDGDGIPSIVDRGDNPENCDADNDCVATGQVCNLSWRFCADRAGGGTGGGSAGTGGGSAGTGGGSAGTGGGSAGTGGGPAGTGGGGASGGRGCGCTSTPDVAMLALAGLGLLFRGRRARATREVKEGDAS